MKYFINLSGGIDSTYYLWKFLTEKPNEKILIHHCLLFEKRREVEKISTDNILNWLKNNGLNNFEYIETEFSKKGIHSKLYDIEVIYFMTALLLKNNYSSIENIIMPRCQEELISNVKLNNHLRNSKSLSEFNSKGNRISNSINLLNMICNKSFIFESMYQHLPKKKMIEEMPEELFNLTWWCRTPKNNKPCGECFNCKRIKSNI